MDVKYNITPGGHSYAVNGPDDCPLCHYHSQFETVKADFTNDNKGVEVVFRCGYRNCRSFFVGYYGLPQKAEILRVKPMKPTVSRLPEAVSTISPTFVAVFVEAEEAAQLGLTQVAGPGYRKAFEFLIKDYAKKLAPEKAAEIERKFSGAVVSEFIADARIQAVAKRCLWLGNDETHYLRKWTGHDVGDLVTLIKLTANWIEIEHLSSSYVESMPE